MIFPQFALHDSSEGATTGGRNQPVPALSLLTASPGFNAGAGRGGPAGERTGPVRSEERRHVGHCPLAGTDGDARRPGDRPAAIEPGGVPERGIPQPRAEQFVVRGLAKVQAATLWHVLAFNFTRLQSLGWLTRL